MDFASIIFLFLFLPLYLIVYYSSKNVKIKNLVLLIFSLLFYSWGEPYFIFLMIFSIIINFWLTTKMSQKNNKFLLFLIILFNVAIIIISKHTAQLLPFGIGIYTLQALSYTIDVYKKKTKAQKNIFKFACYIASFPQLLAGPIVRYKDIENDLSKRKITIDDFTNGIRRFIIGLTKKVLIANSMEFISSSIYNYDLVSTGFIGMLFASISFSLQIYFNLSGYSDMAIGLGKMSGFDFPKNFDYPYMAKSITEFWNRWNITLLSFLKEYIYIPICNFKKSTLSKVISIITVTLLTGLWYGKSWSVIIWGLYFTILLLIEKGLLKNKPKNNPLYRIFILFFINMGWIIFSQTSFSKLLISLKALFGFYGMGNISSLYYLGIFSSRYIITLIIGVLGSTKLFHYFLSKENVLNDLILLCLFIICIIFIITNNYSLFLF